MPNKKGVFEVENENAVTGLWDELSEGHKIHDTPNPKMAEMKHFEASDGTRVQYRSGSKSGGATIDIKTKQKIPFRYPETGAIKKFDKFKVHVVR